MTLVEKYATRRVDVAQWRIKDTAEPEPEPST